MQEEIFRYFVTKCARHERLEWPALAAIIQTESAGIILADIDGKTEPLIRFEGHYFDKLLTPNLQARARLIGLASPKPGAIKNPRTQKARWALLKRAIEIDPAAAYASTSWGVGQVMGANWQWLGYGSVHGLVLEARTSPLGQLRLMLRFLRRAKLIALLQNLDFENFARRYNGPNFAQNRYHHKLRSAYQKFKRQQMPPLEKRNWLYLSDVGPRVKKVQELLARHDGAISIDSDYGPQTYYAVRLFQRQNALHIDGKAGPRTISALRAQLPFWQRFSYAL